jgi:hypothetical protein
MKFGTGPGFRPKTTVPTRGVGLRPAVAAGCYGVVAYRAARSSRRPTVRAHGAREGAVAPVATAHRWLACRGVEGKGTRVVGGCAGQDEKWRGSPRRSGIDEVVKRGRRGGVSTAEDGSLGWGQSGVDPVCR